MNNILKFAAAAGLYACLAVHAANPVLQPKMDAGKPAAGPMVPVQIQPPGTCPPEPYQKIGSFEFRVG